MNCSRPCSHCGRCAISDAMPEGKVAGSHVVSIRTVAAGGVEKAYDLHITDRGETELPLVQFDGLVFEVDRDLLRKLKLQ